MISAGYPLIALTPRQFQELPPIVPSGPGAISVPEELVAWFKADAAIVTGGDSVLNWPDSGLLGNDLSAANNGQRATFEPNWRNGLPGVRGRNGTRLDSAPIAPPVQMPGSFYVVGEWGNGGRTNFLNDDWRIIQPTANPDQIEMSTEHGPESLSLPCPVSVPVMIEAIFNGASSFLRVWQPGSSVATEVSGNVAAGAFVRFNDILRRNGEGLIAESALYRTILSGDDRRSLLAYFRERWNF